MDDICVRIAGQEDVSRMVAIERLSFSDPWSPDSFDSMMGNPCFTVFGAYDKNGLCGFICFFHIAEDIEILNLAVAPDKRRRGIGELLIVRLEEYAARSEAERIFLEARVSNTAARSLYEKHGFVCTRIRKKYYVKPAEDAAVYEKDLKNADFGN